MIKFAELMDSAGYSCDSNRIKKTYGFLDLRQPKLIKGYLFYPLEFENSSLNLSLKDRSSNPFTTEDRTGKPDESEIGYAIFKKSERIMCYYFSQRESESQSEEKWFVDGFVEEWKFTDSITAKAASLQLGKYDWIVYFNRGAFICYGGEYMYIFSSRASGFMYEIKPFFNKFSSANHMVKVE